MAHGMSATQKATSVSKPPHGLTGRRNAAKAVTLDGRTAFRLPLEVKVAAEAAATSAGLSASQWYVAAIRAALSNP